MRHSADMHMAQGVGAAVTNPISPSLLNTFECLAFGGVLFLSPYLFKPARADYHTRPNTLFHLCAFYESYRLHDAVFSFWCSFGFFLKKFFRKKF